MTNEEVRLLFLILILLSIFFIASYKLCIKSLNRKHSVNTKKNVEFMKKVEHFKF